MSKEKQIEEMARDLGIAFQLAGTTRFGEVAEVLVNAGYLKQSEWISVDERLPDKWQRVLVNCNGNVCISWQNANGTWFECWNDKVTHWMPLPKAPKMKGGE